MARKELGPEQMEVKLRVYATLRQYLPEMPLGQTITLSMPRGTSIRQLLERLGIPPGETKNCFVNGLHRDLDYPLEEDDELALFPPVGGG